MAKYNTRPLSVEAQQFKGGMVESGPILKWVNTNGGKVVWCGAITPFTKGEGRIQHPGLPESLRLRTGKGWVIINIGDYIVRTEDAVFFSMDADKFDKTYENELADVIDIKTAQKVDWVDAKAAPIA